MEDHNSQTELQNLELVGGSTGVMDSVARRILHVDILPTDFEDLGTSPGPNGFQKRALD